jgi:hypothetical protein
MLLLREDDLGLDDAGEHRLELGEALREGVLVGLRDAETARADDRLHPPGLVESLAPG